MEDGSTNNVSPSQASSQAPSLSVLQTQARVIGEHSRLLNEASTAVQALNTRLDAQDANQQQRDTQMENLIAMTQALSAQVAALAGFAASPAVPSALQPPAPPTGQPRDPTEPKLAKPTPFDGTFTQCRGFVMQCELMFSHQPSRYFSPAARVAFMANLTTGDALNWAQAILCARPELFNDYAAFLVEFKRVFDHPTAGREVGARLMSLHQGNRTAAAYATEFRTLAAGSGWNDQGLRSAFRQGLSETIKDELVRDKPASLDDLVALAIDVDERIRERRREKARHQPSSSRVLESASGSSGSKTSSPSVAESTGMAHTSEEPMQLGRARLTTAEKQRRRDQGLCLYCGDKGHLRDSCPSLPKD